jgi:phenylacetate-coenzyme A ligase PaaK-like adenylate-forming protein
MILKGVNIFPIQIEKGHGDPRRGTNFPIILDREGYSDSMTVKVEIERSSWRRSHQLETRADRGGAPERHPDHAAGGSG